MTEKRYFAPGRGIKWLLPNGTSIRDGIEFVYNLPDKDGSEKWSRITAHRAPAAADGADCGPGRLHVMIFVSNPYCPGGYRWWAKWEREDVIGASQEKTSVV